VPTKRSAAPAAVEVAAVSRPLVAIVGRPNVGKSTLFNRLLGRRKAIVEDSPGVTRDRHYADGTLEEREITLVDTGGFVPDDEKGERADPLAAHVRLQAQAAVEECHLVLLVVDGRLGATGADAEVARYLRKSGRPVVLVVNKCDDHKTAEVIVADFHRLGLGEPVAISAEHSLGMTTLREGILALLPPAPEKPPGPPQLTRREKKDAKKRAEEAEEAELPPELPEPPPKERPIKVAIVGRPNVGKSTLVNALLGEQRLITSPIAGTTRDPIDSPLEREGRNFILTDTAGIRRKATISQRVEQFSVLGALRVIEDSDVTVLVIDASEPAVDQDARIAGITEEKGRPLLILVNKWDTVVGKVKEEAFREELKYKLPWASWAPVLFCSAKDGIRVEKVPKLCASLFDQSTFRAPTPQLNKLLAHVTTEHPAPFMHGKAVRLYYVAQVGISPPAFAFMCNMPQAIPDRYKRYLTNQLRSTFGLNVPVRLFFRERPGKAKRKFRVAAIKGHKQQATRRRR
jgi:GTP-binding protein